MSTGTRPAAVIAGHRARRAGVLVACALAACSGQDGGGAAATTAATTTTALATTTTALATTTAPPTTLATTTTTILPWQRYPIAPLEVHKSTAVLTHIETTDPVVFLTIDDGFERDPRIPDLLAEHGATATVFIVASAVRDDPAYFQRFVDLGGTVNSHTIRHIHLKALDYRGQVREICGGAKAIAEAENGVSGPFFRPPYGEWNSDTVRAARSCGLRAVVLWHVSVNHSTIVTYGGSIKPGDILIFHFRDDLYTDLQTVFAELDRLGLTVARLEDYLPAP